jgi:hypothetical protein
MLAATRSKLLVAPIPIGACASLLFRSLLVLGINRASLLSIFFLFCEACLRPPLYVTCRLLYSLVRQHQQSQDPRRATAEPAPTPGVRVSLRHAFLVRHKIRGILFLDTVLRLILN